MARRSIHALAAAGLALALLGSAARGDARSARQVTIAVDEAVTATDGPNIRPPIADAEAVAVADQVTVNATPLADLSLTKSDSPDPVQPGGTLTYTVTVGNAGPRAAANATVSDQLPAQTTFSGFAQPPPGWSCGFDVRTSTATCTNPSFASGASGTFQFTAQVGANATGTISNTATVSSSLTDPTPADDSATARTTVGTPTAVTLVSFTATRWARSVLIHWRTASENSLAGFNVYRRSADGWIRRLNRRLIPARGSPGASYRLVDRLPRARSYRLELVRRDGGRSHVEAVPSASRRT